MTSYHYEQVEALFDAALALPADQRRQYLKEHAPDSGIRREVEAMLVMDQSTWPALKSPSLASALSGAISGALAGELERELKDDREADLPKEIGRYRILRRLGAGGMGIVYEAEQGSPKRRVALKVMRRGLFSRQMLRRFEVEAHVLGQLHHPGIAQIYESGTASSAGAPGMDDGDPQPYFAMELIDGLPLKAYARDKGCSIRERLELIVQAAEAVQHAHQKGVIHRDLKPDNILVDENGQPKVLDFGVARAVNANTMLTTLQTDAGQIIGTLAYMSPEQVAGLPEEVDTRSDVYSLGVILYELLAGSLPLDVTQKSVPAALRMIQEIEPRRLSEVDVRLRGDLQTIVAKAMEKDKTRRYQSAFEFAADIRRHLNDEPIIARPASAFYQFRKFAKRNKALVGGAAGIFASVTLGMFVATWFAVDASVQRREAVEARDDAQHQRDAARELAYRSTIAAASASLAAEDHLAAKAHLEDAPGDLRGWEWNHLRTRLNAAALVIDGLGGFAQEIAIIDHCRLNEDDGARSIYVIANSALNVFDATNGRLVRRVPIGEGRGHYKLAVSPDGARLLVEEHASEHRDLHSHITMYEIAADENGALRKNWTLNNARAGREAFSPDGSHVAAALPAEGMLLWLDASSGAELARHPIDSGDPFDVAYIGESESSEDIDAIMYVTIGRNRTGDAGIVHHDGHVTQHSRHNVFTRTVFDALGRNLAWEVWTDGRVNVVDMKTGELRQIPQRAGRERVPLAFSRFEPASTPENREQWLAIGEEEAVLIWDVVNWAPLAMLPGHEHTLTTGRFSRDGDLLVTGDEGGVVRLWTMPPPQSPWIVERWEH